MEDDDLPRMRGDAASRLAGEALDTYSQDELMARIRLLEAEIERVRAHHAKAASHRDMADALFKPRDTD
ncbi:hypothetical protein WYH_02330 [Croceibacterium atlanticum]|uniref:DUF1192 domain-containing protein n=1 Tax=Croceibacterium atlanticum TaxID=1267766 RepID=A0A0F7KVY1_9SPHN|nr:DUF1192 domain-containing protein [Croceibacterium atlanticum]AKH43362.1 hypothetical protein WYH_02330 [Croceibacterium atlanticum]